MLRDFWSEMDKLHDRVNRVLRNVPGFPSKRDYPAINIWRSEDRLVLTAEMPGVNPEDLDISVEDNLLTLTGVRKTTEMKEGETLHLQERLQGEFKRHIELPYRIDKDKVEAKLINGILQVNLPRSDEEKPRKITVNVQ